MSRGKKVLVGCAGAAVLALVLAWLYGGWVVKLFTMTYSHGAGDTVLMRRDGGLTNQPLELRVFIDPQDGGR